MSIITNPDATPPVEFRRPGRPSLPVTRRRVARKVYLLPEQWDAIDEARGTESRGAFVSGLMSVIERLSRELSVECGEVEHAPDGWAKDEDEDEEIWDTSIRSNLTATVWRERAGLWGWAVRDVSRSHYGVDVAGGSARTALEAMQAADVAMAEQGAT